MNIKSLLIYDKSWLLTLANYGSLKVYSMDKLKVFFIVFV